MRGSGVRREGGGMTYQLTVVYGRPEDPAAFDEHYANVHAPLAAKIPGLESYTGHRAEPPAEASAAAEATTEGVVQ